MAKLKEKTKIENDKTKVGKDKTKIENDKAKVGKDKTKAVKEKKYETKNDKLVIILFVLMVVSLVVIYGCFYLMNLAKLLNHNELDKANLGITSLTADLNNNVTNIALFGVDQRFDETQTRSDSIMILTVDKVYNKIKITSVMRDTAVNVDGYGQQKINSAYFYGGAQLAVKTLNQNFGLNISEYATVNFQQMAQIIDALGGVDLDVSEAERLDANNSIYEQASTAGMPIDIIESAGYQTLSGTQAVAFARIRRVSTSDGTADDFGRTERQREVFEQMFEKALDMNPLRYSELAKELLPAFETSLNLSEIIDLSTIMLRNVKFVDMRIPENDDLIGDGVVYIGSQQALNVNLESASSKLYDFIYRDILVEAS